MGMWDDQPSRDETLRRAIRDGAVNEAMGTHRDALRANDTDHRLVSEIAQLAVHNALLRYSAEMAGSVARIESFERMRYEQEALRPSPVMLQVLMDTLSPPAQDPR